MSGLLEKIGWYSTIAPKSVVGPLKGFPNRLSYGVSQLPESLRHYTDSDSIPSNLITTFHPILTVAIQLKYPVEVVTKSRKHRFLLTSRQTESPHFNTSSIRDKWHRWKSRSTRKVPSLIPENCLRVQATLCSPDCLSNQNGRCASGLFASFLSFLVLMLVWYFQGFLPQSPGGLFVTSLKHWTTRWTRSSSVSRSLF